MKLGKLSDEEGFWIASYLISSSLMVSSSFSGTHEDIVEFIDERASALADRVSQRIKEKLNEQD